MWIEIVMLDGNRGLINLNNVVDIWKDIDDDFATIIQVTGEEIEIPASEYDNIKQKLSYSGQLRH